ncbi:MAG TPA: DUF4157 domain-containing protein [Allosphingosinicella sp.]|nr:DUF4157 domain-containing protein [Allosphingosinicella sp.]
MSMSVHASCRRSVAPDKAHPAPARGPARDPDRRPAPAAGTAFVSDFGIGFARIPLHGEAVSRPRHPAPLRISSPGEPAEREADLAADRVMRGQRVHLAAAAAPPLARKCAARDEAHGEAATAPPAVAAALGAPGRPLEAAARAEFEPCFGISFADVRIHADSAAAAAAHAIGARAFTLGRRIGFAAGEYAPASPVGRRLLAHELAHVAQEKHFGTPSLVRRQAAFDSAGAPAQDYVEDYEQGVSRPARPEEMVSHNPDALEEIAGEFWVHPANVPLGSRPVVDEESGVVVGFRGGGSGLWMIYDLQGNVVETGEAPLESPLIDPIDLVAGGITALGRGIFRAGAPAVVRSIGAAGVTGGRGAVNALVRSGVAVALRALTRRAVTALRAAYRALRFARLNFTRTAALRMADPARHVPVQILQLALRYGARSADPQGVAGAFRYVIPMFRNGTQYTLEVVIREADRMVLHFLYR